MSAIVVATCDEASNAWHQNMDWLRRLSDLGGNFQPKGGQRNSVVHPARKLVLRFPTRKQARSYIERVNQLPISVGARTTMITAQLQRFRLRLAERDRREAGL